MIKKNSTLAFVLLTSLLFGCHEEVKTGSWYMLHPQALQQEIMVCQENAGFGEGMPQCKIAMSAAEKISDIVSRQQEDPERFGQHVLQAQQNLQQLNDMLIKARETVNELNSKKASPAELQAAQVDLDNAEKSYAEQLQQINVMLAVLAMSSPG